MRIRTTVAAFVLAGTATLSLSGTASAQQADRDCPDFATQAEAQAALESRAGDPERLDRDNDRIACEDHFGEPDDRSDENTDEGDEAQVRTKPRGGVETGDGTTDEGGLGGMLLVLTGIGAGGAAVVTVRRRAASHSR